MDVLLEFILSLIGGCIEDAKASKARTWAMTVFCGVLVGIVLALFLWVTFEAYRSGSMLGVIILALVELAWAVICAVLLVKGHRSGWKRIPSLAERELLVNVNSKTDRIWRALIFVIAVVFFPVFFCVGLLILTEDTMMGLLTFVIGLTIVGLAYLMLSIHPKVFVGEKGVYVRAVFKTQYCLWTSVKQAGVLWVCHGWWHRNELVLLRPNGSPRRDQDKTFLLRNLGRTIRITSCSDAVKRYVTEHYGPLDFDLSDGRGEVAK